MWEGNLSTYPEGHNNDGAFSEMRHPETKTKPTVCISTSFISSITVFAMSLLVTFILHFFCEYTYLQIDYILVDAETHCSLVMTSNVLRLTILYHVIH